MTLVIDPKVALLKGVDPVQFCVFIKFGGLIRPHKSLDILFFCSSLPFCSHISVPGSTSLLDRAHTSHGS